MSIKIQYAAIFHILYFINYNLYTPNVYGLFSLPSPPVILTVDIKSNTGRSPCGAGPAVAALALFENIPNEKCSMCVWVWPNNF